MPITSYSGGPLDNNTYVIVDGPSGDAAIVDPAFEADAILQDIQARDLHVRFVLNTHAHFDHCSANGFFVERLGVPLALHRGDLDLLRISSEQGKAFGFPSAPSPDPDWFLEHGQTLRLGNTSIGVRHTPGHSPGGVCLVLENAVIVGDTLFAGSIGRTDLPGGALETLLHSIRTQIFSLPDETCVLSGHGPATTVGREKRTNPWLRQASEEGVQS